MVLLTLAHVKAAGQATIISTSKRISATDIGHYLGEDKDFIYRVVRAEKGNGRTLMPYAKKDLTMQGRVKLVLGGRTKDETVLHDLVTMDGETAFLYSLSGATSFTVRVQKGAETATAEETLMTTQLPERGSNYWVRRAPNGHILVVTKQVDKESKGKGDGFRYQFNLFDAHFKPIAEETKLIREVTESSFTDPWIAADTHGNFYYAFGPDFTQDKQKCIQTILRIGAEGGTVIREVCSPALEDKMKFPNALALVAKNGAWMLGEDDRMRFIQPTTDDKGERIMGFRLLTLDCRTGDVMNDRIYRFDQRFPKLDKQVERGEGWMENAKISHYAVQPDGSVMIYGDHSYGALSGFEEYAMWRVRLVPDQGLGPIALCEQSRKFAYGNTFNRHRKEFISSNGVDYVFLVEDPQNEGAACGKVKAWDDEGRQGSTFIPMMVPVNGAEGFGTRNAFLKGESVSGHMVSRTGTLQNGDALFDLYSPNGWMMALVRLP